MVCPALAHAQVTIDLRALDALPNAPGPMAAPKPVARPVPKPEAAKPMAAKPEATKRGTPAQTATVTPPPLPPRPATPITPPSPTPSAATPPAAPVPPTPVPPTAELPTGAPPAVALAPIPPPPVPATTAPPATPDVSVNAGTTATPETSGLQLVFKPAESDLSPDADAAVGRLVKATPSGDTISYNVIAYAAGRADDPSVARRTSLARGLAVRGALIADGVPSTRIYVRAMGSGGGDGPADRVDVTVMGLSGAVPVKQ